MKKFTKHIITVLTLVFMLAFPSIARAEAINLIDVVVEIDENGIGHVTETWETEDDNYDATERYKVISDLRGIEIRDFKVSNASREFSEKDPWNLDASFHEKAYRYGMVEGDDKVELCWGISEHGSNTFTLQYTINPLVVSLNDYDMVYWRFIKENLSPLPNKIRMEVSGYEDFDDDVGLWAFGFEGEVHNEDGKIVAESDGDVAFGQLMLRFPKGTFNTSYTMDEDFRYFEEQAIENSRWDTESEYYEDSEYSYSGSRGIFGAIAGFGTFIISMIAVIVAIVVGASSATPEYGLLNKKDLEKSKKFKNQYYQEVPYDGPIEDTYLIADNAYQDISFENYMNAYFLKWVYESAITFAEDEVNQIVRTKKVPYIRVNHKPDHMGPVEAKFFNVIEGAARYDDDGKLTQREIERYMKDNKSYMERFIDSFPENSLEALEKDGYLVNDKKRSKNPFAKSVYKNNISITDSGKRLYENFIKFKNYLEDYSLIEERHVNEVKLWDKFMIYAAIYGISQEVYKNFTAIYPEYEQMSMYDYYMLRNITSYSSNISSTMATNISNFESSSSGGFSSFSGGGGSFGGGSGGSGGGSR